MADYSQSSGAGQIMVRDLGSTVEFWMYTPYSLNWNNLQFNVDANGTTSYFSANYNGRGFWLKVGQITVNSSQSINFRLLTRTNTSSIAGPTTMSVSLERGRVPDAPGAPRVAETGSTHVVLNFQRGGDGGLPLDTLQIGWGKNPGGPERFDWVGDWVRFDGLDKGATYYFWGQQHNAKGWGPWSARSQTRTVSEPPGTTPVFIDSVTQTSFRYGFVGNGDGGAPIQEWQIAYGTDPNAAQFFMSSGGTSTITGLQPATLYYVWARGRNTIGWGPFSVRWQVRTIAGAFVKVGLVQKEAIPYVKVDGVWRLARPWVKQAGVWKETQ